MPIYADHNICMDLRDRIRSVIDADDRLSVRNVSLRAGLSDSWLHKLLNGDVRSPTLEAIEKLADALDVDPRWLAFGEGTPEMFSDIGEMLSRASEDQAEMARQMLRVLLRSGTAA